MTAKNYIKTQILDKCDPLTREEEKVASIHDLVKHNLRYMISAYSNYLKHMPFEEYVSEIINAMYIAAEKFNRNSGNKFATYASIWVSVMLSKYWQKFKNGNGYGCVSISESSWKKLNKISKFRKEFEKENGRKPELVDYQNKFDKTLTDKTLRNHIFYSQNGYSTSIDQEIPGEHNESGSKRTFGDTLGESSVFDSSQKEVYEEIEYNDTLNSIWSKINTFSTDHQKVAACLYIDGLTVKQAAEKLNMHPHKVTNISNEVIKKLQNEFITERV